MAFLQCNFYSQTLKTNTTIGVILPSPDSNDIFGSGDLSYFTPGVRFQTLYLFHGAYGDYSDWTRNTSIERYAQQHRIAVVMPSVANSFYQDMVQGEPYLTFVSEELPQFVQTAFPLSAAREDNFTAGLSMGGYGALKVALSHPEQYAAAASLSGAIDLVRLAKDNASASGSHPFPFERIFQDYTHLDDTDADLFHLIRQNRIQNRPEMKFFISCGTEDFLYPLHLNAKKTLLELGADTHFEEHPGAHNWEYWDAHIQRALDWMPLKNRVL
ncbi:MAG: alpha/beta hydrolase family protein [Christensenella sp.]|nr:alpha/beta hydrolase family protein [Christensenella sp.]